MKKKWPAWAALVVVSVIAVAVVLLSDRLTAEPIARKQAAAEEAALEALLDGAERFEPVEARESRYAVKDVYRALDADGELAGYIGTTTVTGFGGPMEVTAGLNTDGVVTGVSVGGDDFSETPGLGALTRVASFTDQFTGKTPVFTLGEDGVDTISGASTTSRAVVAGVNNIANYFYAGELGLAEEDVEVYTGQTVSATRKGFAGDVTATVGLAEDGTIEYLAIDTPDETDGLGKLASEKAFTSQFVGKRGPFAYGEDGIEAVTGATYTSDAALEAINEIVSGGGEASAEPVTATAKGYGGDVTVTARLNADNTISALSVDTPDETDGLGKQCSDSAFTGQFIGKAAPFAYGEDGIEAVTGATYTSNAVLEALNSVVPAGDKTASAPVEATGEPESEPETETEPAPEPQAQAPDESQGDAAPAGNDGEAAASAADYMKYMRPRLETAESETAADSGADYMKYMRPRLDTAESETPADTDADYMKYMRPRIETAEPEEAEAEDEETATASGDASKYMRARPEIVVTESVEEAEVEEAATASGDASKYMRARPEIAVTESVEETEVEETAIASGDASKYMRARPEITVTESAEAEDEPEEPETTTSGDASKYMRVRPEISVTESAEAEAEPEETETPASGDASKYMRTRPEIVMTESEEETEVEETATASGDTSKYMRVRPEIVVTESEEQTEVEETATASSDASKYMRARLAA